MIIVECDNQDIREGNMINTQTVQFIGFLNMIAEKNKNGIRPFSTATVQDKRGLLYDDKNPIEIGDDDEVYSSYPLVFNSFIDESHHDIVSTWTKEYAADGIKVAVVVDESGTYVSISSEYNDDFSILVVNGFWCNLY